VAKVTWPTFQILGPPNIYGTAADTNLKFYMQIDFDGYRTKKMKNWSKVGVA